MKASTKVLSVSLFVSLLTCLLFAYLWIDTVITLSYSEQCFNNSTKSKRLLEGLIEHEWQGRSKQHILNTLQRASERYPKWEAMVIKDEPNKIIFYSNIPFLFKDGQLQKVGSDAEPVFKE